MILRSWHMFKNEDTMARLIDVEILKFIKDNIEDFSTLDIIRYFAESYNPVSDLESISKMTGLTYEELKKAIFKLIEKKIIYERIINGEIRYELSRDNKILEYVKRFYSYYKVMSIRLVIIGYILNKRIKK